mgnify:CR=1 FL=1
MKEKLKSLYRAKDNSNLYNRFDDVEMVINQENEYSIGENKKKKKKAINDKEYMQIVKDIINNETVAEMKKYRQHYDINTFEHCLNVSYISYRICKKLKWDYKSMARGAMLHDLFLYDWRNSKKELNLDGYHAFVHPKIALENASKLYDLNDKEKDIIVKHMWPVTLSLPKYKESFVITLVDKYSALQESAQYYRSKIESKKLFRYAYIFFGLIFLRKII